MIFFLKSDYGKIMELQLQNFMLIYYGYQYLFTNFYLYSLCCRRVQWIIKYNKICMHYRYALRFRQI